MNRILGLLCLMFLLAHCVSAPDLESRLDSFVNVHEDAVVEQLGDPTRIDVNEAGNRILTYGRRGVFRYPDCEASFVLNENGLVERWSWNGRNCNAFGNEEAGYL